MRMILYGESICIDKGYFLLQMRKGIWSQKFSQNQKEKKERMRDSGRQKL